MGKALDATSKEPETATKPTVVVGIGASAGGWEAIEVFLKHLSPKTGMAFVLVQHLDPDHPSIMPELVAKVTSMPVVTAQEGLPVRPNHVYVIPPNVTLTIKEGVLHAHSPSAQTAVRSHIDTFFRSLAEDQAENAACVVLSGAGSDGTLGLKAVKTHAGITLAQTPESAKFSSMPLSAIATGLVDFSLPVEQIAARLMEHSEYLNQLKKTKGIEAIEREIAERLPRICTVLHRETGHDFSRYKQSTMVRRVERRVQVERARSVDEYVAALERDPAEAKRLLKDLVISVTEFFRDPETFEVLGATVIPKLLENKDPEARVRLWVPACASGEEAYSIAILLSECMARLNVVPQIQIFATDIDEQALEVARLGKYPPGIVEHVSSERLSRFFVRHDDFFQISKQIREMCIFSAHNLLRDPPFSSLDLISCRNLLIYLEGELQKKLEPLFHYALRPGGFLLLGPSEGLSGQADLFHVIDKKHRLFQAQEAAVRPPVAFPLAGPSPAGPGKRAPLPRRGEPVPEQDLSKVLCRVILEEYAPPCVVVNEQAQILYCFGETGRYLEQPTGTPTTNLLEMARKGLRLSLRSVLNAARKTGETAVQRGVPVKTSAGVQQTDLIARPMSELGENTNLFAVVFQPVAAIKGQPMAKRLVPHPEESAIQQLESELKRTRGELQTTVEELEAANEEMRSSNEELLSMNEEMQSANEELQTSKEELQSVNEELETVNTELSNKLRALDTANADLQNLFRSTDIATLFLDRDLRIRRFTPAATAVFHLLNTDMGRPISDLAPRFAQGDLIADVKEVLQTLAIKERQAYHPETRSWFLVRILPSRTTENVIDGVVATFVDITPLTKAQKSLTESEERFRLLVEGVQDYAIYMLDAQGKVATWNIGAQRIKGYQADEIIGQNASRLFTPEDVEAGIVRTALETATREGRYEGEHWLVRKDGSRFLADTVLTALKDQNGALVGFSEVSRDITQRKQAEEALAEAKTRAEEARAAAESASRAKDHFLAVLSHELRTPLSPVVASVSLLQRDERLDAEQRESIETIRRNVELEARLIDDMLDVTRIARGKVELHRRPVELGKLLERTQEICQNEIDTRNVQFALEMPDAPYAVNADPARLQQVFWNLLNNAIKFTPPGGHVGIRTHREGDHHVVAEVYDDGKGIEPELLPRLFTAFEQGDRHTTRQFGGLGLGLAISKGLTEMHGGTLTVRSDGTGTGATFTVRLPLLADTTTQSPDPAAKASDSHDGPGHGLHILLVEDHADTARMMGRLLRAEGYYVRAAGDVATALQVARQEPFDVLVSDVGLPDGNGLQLMEQLRRLYKLKGIALSGYGMDDDIEKSRAAGFAAHLTKPVDPHLLLDILGRVATG